jgi:type III pantothenate kinase
MITNNHNHPDLLAIDIGNTHVTLAPMLGDEPLHPACAPTARLDQALQTLEESWKVVTGPQPALVIASVVPAALGTLRAAIKSTLGTNPLILREDIPLPMTLAIQNPDSVGVDRICAAAAAFARLQQACTVVDFGTAVTVDYVDDDGVFCGGAILPGLDLAATSLSEHTAALPHVRVTEAPDPIGRNTDQAIRSGVFFGLIGAIRELTERYATHLGRWPHLVATGGAAPMIARTANFIDSVVPHLCLMGIALAYRRHRQEQPRP